MTLDTQVTNQARPLHPAEAPIHGVRPGAVRLTVRNLDRMRRFWTDTIGLAEMGSTGNVVQFGVGQRVLVELAHVKDAPLPAHNAAGLFHIAIVFATRADLAAALRRVSQSGARLTGASDHLVSEALYLDDPEGNGVELYWDRSPAQWSWTSHGLQIAANRLDLGDLLRQNDASRAIPAVAPATTRVGHVHLKVTNVAASEAWYRTNLGLDTNAVIPDAAFLSSDNYHHHIGMNTWASKAGPAAEIGAAGLASFEMLLPPAAVTDVAGRLARKKIDLVRHSDGLSVRDPSGITVRLRESV